MNNTKKNLSNAVWFLVITLAVCVTVTAGASGWGEKNSSAEAVILLAQAESCADKCGAKKKSCMAKYTRTNINGVKFVTPEGVKLCSVAYRECKSYCE
jgi:hypothetical protein